MNIQAPISEHEVRELTSFFDAWSFSGAWMLEFGAFGLLS
jgi:hypothetical protein